MERLHITCVFVYCRKSNLLLTIISWENICQVETHTIMFFLGWNVANFSYEINLSNCLELFIKYPKLGLSTFILPKLGAKWEVWMKIIHLKREKKHQSIFFHRNSPHKIFTPSSGLPLPRPSLLFISFIESSCVIIRSCKYFKLIPSFMKWVSIMFMTTFKLGMK